MPKFDSTAELQKIILKRFFSESEILSKWKPVKESKDDELALHTFLIALSDMAPALKSLVEFDYVYLNHSEYIISGAADQKNGQLQSIIAILNNLQALVKASTLLSKSASETGADLVKVLLYASLIKFVSFIQQDVSAFSELVALIKDVEAKFPVKEQVDCWVFTGSCLVRSSLFHCVTNNSSL